VTDEARIIYAGKRRAVAACGPVTAQVEYGETGDVLWVEVRRSGTGGPMSGELLARLDDRDWPISDTFDHKSLVEMAMKAWNEKASHLLAARDSSAPSI
jgi:hypothetical protein